MPGPCAKGGKAFHSIYFSRIHQSSANLQDIQYLLHMTQLSPKFRTLTILSVPKHDLGQAAACVANIAIQYRRHDPDSMLCCAIPGHIYSI